MTANGHRRDGWLFATLAAVTVVTAIVSSLGAPLVPSIAADHGVSLATAQWALTSTLIAAAAATPALGRWGSGRLRRPVVLGGLGVVLLGCLLAAVAEQVSGMGVLIGGRALQGVGLAIPPLALAVARDAWSGERLVSRLSLLSVATVAGAGLGYPVAGVLAEVSGVAGAYLAGAAMVTIALALGWRHLPHDAEGEPQAVDLWGVGLVGLGLVGALLAVSQGSAWGWTSAPVLGLAGGGVVLLLWWGARSIRLTRRGRQPLVDLVLAARPALLRIHLFTVMIATAMYTLLTLVVLLVRGNGDAGWGLDRGATSAGLVLVPYALLSVAGSRVALRIARRSGPRVLLPLGGAVFASSLVLLALAHDTFWQALVVMAIGGIGSGFTFSSLPMLMVPHVPRSETGSALGFNQLMRYTGFAIGSAITIALVEAYGGDEAAFRWSALTLAALCLASAVAVTTGGSERVSRQRT